MAKAEKQGRVTVKYFNPAYNRWDRKEVRDLGEFVVQLVEDFYTYVAGYLADEYKAEGLRGTGNPSEVFQVLDMIGKDEMDIAKEYFHLEIIK